MSQHELPGLVFPWERTQMGLERHISRLAKQDMQQACAERLTKSLTGRDLQHVCTDTDKMFCSTWLNHDNVLVGSKCNKLRIVHLPSQTHQDVPYPAQPVHRQGPDLLARGNRAHCGQHDLSVSPSGCYLVTGGAAAEDIILWRLQDSSDASTSSNSSSSSSRPGSSIHMQPVQTFMGHADWVFGLDWLSDRHWVSGGRDGTIKLWQVPDAAAQATYTTDPGSALLSSTYHAGKVRAISFDQQQQQVVALSTDETISWWTPDLQLKGSARFSDVMDPVAIATNGPVVVVGSSSAVHVLDTRARNAGYRSNSSSHPGRKRSRNVAFGPRVDMGPQSPAAAAMPMDDEEWARLQSYLQPVRWLPAAYPRSRPVPPVVLAVTGSVRGMQEVQKTSATVGMDPMLAEQLLRREAARQAVAQGQSFDAALEALVSRLMQLHPRQQLEQLTALSEKSNQGAFGSAQQQPAPRQRGRSMQQPGSVVSSGLEAAAQRMLDLLASGGQGPTNWQGAQQMFPELFSAPGGRDADYMDDDPGYDSDPYGDGFSDTDDDDYGPQGPLWRYPRPYRLPPAAQAAVTVAASPADLPNALRYFQERTQPRSQYAFNGDVQQMQRVQQLQQAGLRLPGCSTQDLKARVSSKLRIHETVRSISIHNDHILGVGQVSMDFYDMRRMHGQDIYTGFARQDSSLLLRRLEMRAARMNVDPVLREYGFGEIRNIQSTVYTHCWDPSGTRVLAAGGALALGCRGAFVQVLT